MPRDKFEPEDPKARWMSDGRGPNRNMVLLEKFIYWDRKGKEWDAPETTEVDGATIPRPLWAIVGSPYTGAYRRGSILHDVACVRASGDAEKRKQADRMYYEACRKGGCSVAEAIIQYLGVRIGAWAGRIKPLDLYAHQVVVADETDTQRREREIADAIIVGTFNELFLGVEHIVTARNLTPEQEEDAFGEVEKEVDRQLDIKTEQLQNVRSR